MRKHLNESDNKESVENYPFDLSCFVVSHFEAFTVFSYVIQRRNSEIITL